MEGEEKTPNNTPQGHSEFELTLVLILIGLFGIAFFAWYVGSGQGKPDTQKSNIEFSVESAELPSVNTIATEAQKFDIVADENIEQMVNVILLATTSKSRGDYFTNPNTNASLYITNEGCLEACLELWEPYFAERSTALGRVFTIVRSDTEALQYTFRGYPLYMYKADKEGETLGLSEGRMWSLAKPQ